MTSAEAVPAVAMATLGPRPLLIAGAGSIGTRHLRNLQWLGYENVVLFRTGTRPLRGLRSRVRIERDLATALAPTPLATFVCNPTALHLPLALTAARAGSHLFIEKPVSHSIEGLATLAAEVSRRSLVALVGYQFRFHPALRQIKAWLEEGAIGDVASARAYWGEYLPDWHPGEDFRAGYSARRDLGGGALLTLSHPFDYLRWLLGEVEAVQASAAQRGGLGLDVEDVAHVLLRFESGALASISLDYLARPATHGLELVGRKGVIRWCDTEGPAQLFRGDRLRARSHAMPSGFDRNSMFLDELRHFLSCLAGRERPRCTLDDGVRALRVALAAQLSAREGRLVRV